MSTVWAGNVKHRLFPLGMGWGGVVAGGCLHGPIVSSGDCAGEGWPEGPFAQVPPGECPRIRHWGNLLVKGCLRHLCRVATEGPFMGTPFSAPEHPSFQVVAGQPVLVLLGNNAWCLFIAAGKRLTGARLAAAE